MNYQYKFIKFTAKDEVSKIESQLNELGSQGWKIINFHPTSDLELGSKGIFKNAEPWDVGYAFVLVKESN